MLMMHAPRIGWTKAGIGTWPPEDITATDFVVREAGRLPDPGEKVEIGGRTVEIESIENDRILSMIVTPPRAEDEPQEKPA